jgi:hypothetical protein
MSRGLGRLERFILAKLEEVDSHGNRPPASAQATMLARDFYEPADWYTNGGNRGPHEMPALYVPTPAQRKAMTHAFHSFVRKHPQYALMGGNGRKTLLLYEPADPVSTAWAKAMLTRRFVSYMEARKLAQEGTDD